MSRGQFFLALHLFSPELSNCKLLFVGKKQFVFSKEWKYYWQKKKKNHFIENIIRPSPQCKTVNSMIHSK